MKEPVRQQIQRDKTHRVEPVKGVREKHLPLRTSYQGRLLPATPCDQDVYKTANDYKAIILSNLAFIVDRFYSNGSYPWVDTKFDLLTGSDFDEHDPVRGKSAVYSWIQCRALEALSTFAPWLRRDYDGTEFLSQIEKIIYAVANRLIMARSKNGGHLYFWVSPQGDPFVLNSKGEARFFSMNENSPYNFSDVFCSKGLYAAGCYLNDQEMMKEGKEYIHQVEESLWNGSFRSDQFRLGFRNTGEPVAERREQGPFIIQIGGTALLAMHEADSDSVDMGIRLIDYVLSKHINLRSDGDGLAPYDSFEYINQHSDPFLDNGRIVCDPGHAIEFVGLALKFTSVCRRLDCLSVSQRRALDRIESLMPAILEHNFGLGFQQQSGGIVKQVDLISRQVVNPDMPWWSLPEAIRAAMFCVNTATTDEDRRKCLGILGEAHNAFVKNYICPDYYLLPYQTCDQSGTPIDSIPAVPDIDPCYHTGLCLLDTLHLIEKGGGPLPVT